MKHSLHLFATAFFLLGLAPAFAGNFDLSQAVLVVRPGELPNAEKTAATVLIEEVQKRSGVRLSKSVTWPSGKPVIALTSAPQVQGWNRYIPASKIGHEGYRLYLTARV